METKRWRGERTIRKWDNVDAVMRAMNDLYREMFNNMKLWNMVVEADTIRLDIHVRREKLFECGRLSNMPNNQASLVEMVLTCTMRSATSRSYDPTTIYKNGRSTAVKWEDGTVTTVKLAEGEPECDYNAFTAALAIKAIGNNSRIRKILKNKTVIQKKKEK